MRNFLKNKTDGNNMEENVLVTPDERSINVADAMVQIQVVEPDISNARIKAGHLEDRQPPTIRVDDNVPAMVLEVGSCKSCKGKEVKAHG